jgi:hypothetical protein
MLFCNIFFPPNTGAGYFSPQFVSAEAHQGVMTDRRHSLKRGDRLSKKERQTTASDSEKATNCDLCYGSKVTATFVTIKQATKQLQNE